MKSKKNSIVSKGWFIIGIVLIVTGLYLIFLSNSFYTEANQLEQYSEDTTNNIKLIDIANNLSFNAILLAIASIIIITIGMTMCIEWISFSRFLKKISKD